ncbi:MAG: PcfJ domain-containing protein, partial [Rhodobacterales bacterium]|nr:PcfJ domain-containing protein [Rhodobacterales bacterium]
EPVLALGDGWRWLRLTSEAALDYEGRRMRHCAGEGGYDRFRTQIFSLRDPANQPHCTVEFDPERARVQQARGRTNVDVPDRYMDHLAVLVEHLRPKRMNARLTEFAIAESGDILRVSRAADWAAGTRIRHHLVLTNRGDVSVLPEGLHVNGAMILANCALDRLPRNLTVCQAIAGLSLSPVTMLPDGLTVGALNLEDSLVKGLAPGTRVLGEMNMIHSLVHDLPPGLSVGKFLILDGDALGPLPDDLAVAGRPCAGRVPTRLPGGLVVIGDVTGADVLFDGQERVTIYGNLNFARWPHPELPRRLTVTGNLDLSRTDLPAASLDTRVDVAGDLILTDTPLPRLPDGWRVAGNVIR